MMKFALINDNCVVNIFICDSEKLACELFSNDGLVVNVDGTPVSVGWLYSEGEFIEPVINKTKDEIAAENLALAREGYVQASEQITALMEQIEDEDYADATEYIVKESLSSWTDYRKKLRAYIKAEDGSQSLPVAP